MTSCKSIQLLPNSIGQMKQLERLILSFCSKLAILPDEVGRLHHLEELDFPGCSSLRRLPTSMGGLQRLKRLDINWKTGMELPCDLEKLTCLTFLSIRSNWKIGHLEQLTSSFGAFTALKSLRLMNITTIKVLPASLGSLKSLVHLMIYLCDTLLRIEGFPQGLHHLDIWNCSKLNQVPSMVGRSSLMSISFRNCRSLTRVQGFECLTVSEEIDLSGCILLVDCGLLGMHNRALRKCMLSGSNLVVAYDNKWLEREPSSQPLSYDDSSIVSKESILEEVILEVTISSEADCVALILCVLANSPDRDPLDPYEYIHMVVQIMRDVMLVAHNFAVFMA